MSAYVYLGDMSVREIEREHGFEFTDDEREFLEKHHHRIAEFKDGENGWHMFDIPKFLEFSNGPIGFKCLDIFIAHNGDFAYQFPAGYGCNEVVQP